MKGETTLCTDFGGYVMAVEAPNLEEERLHSPLHDAPYSIAERAGQFKLPLASGCSFWLTKEEILECQSISK